MLKKYVSTMYTTLCIILLTCSNGSLLCARNIKVLVLIITSDDNPVYPELQKIWRSYMHNDPEHVETYFIRGNPHLATQYAIEKDVIWSKSPENLIPGLTNKTILSMEAMLPRLHEFDYVLRTNLSSFYIFPRMLKFLEHCPSTNFYCGSHIGDPSIGSGSGFLLSPDVVKMLINNKRALIDNTYSYDDVVIGMLLRSRGIRLAPQARTDFYNRAMWEQGKNNIPSDTFQIRVKNTEDHLRLKDDIHIHTQLRDRFYPQSTTQKFINVACRLSKKGCDYSRFLANIIP